MATEETTEAAAAGAEAAAHGAEAAPGMPQLDFSTFPNQIFWLVVALVALYFVLSRVALPRIGAVLAERKGTITNDLAAAEDLKLRAEEAEEAYQKALADAHAEAQRVIAEKRAEIQHELDLATDKANAEISARTAESEKRISEIRAAAMESVTEVACDTAGEIVAALGVKADAKSIAAAVAERTKG